MNKKMMATLCAVATAVSTFAPTMVYADTIGGDTVYVDKTIYSMTLPTTAKQNFVIDPEGLAGGTIGDTGVITPGDAGAIITDTAGMKAINSSSMPVALETSLKVTGDAAIGDDADDTKEAEEPTVFFTATFAEGKAENGSAATLPSPATVDLTGDAEEYDCILPAATYTFALADGVNPKAEGFDKTDIANYVYKMTADTESGALITLSGACAKDADWSAYVGKDATMEVGLEIIFKFFKTKDTSDSDPTQIKDDTKQLDVEAFASWAGSTLWIGKDSASGFGKDAAVQISEKGGEYTALTATKDAETGWISVEWTDIAAKLADKDKPNYTIKVTDGPNSFIYTYK